MPLATLDRPGPMGIEYVAPGASPFRARRAPRIYRLRGHDMNLSTLPVPVQTFGLLVLANIFMTFAWYGHLKTLGHRTWLVAALISWGIALFEYLLQVPANRIGFAGGLTLAQLKIGQEVITLAIFIPFAVFYMQQPLKLDYLWAGLCLVGAVYFIFRD
jgi:uncharacterized protein (DUF486 family)